MAVQWYVHGMRTTIDAAGRIVVPKALREELGFAPGTELDVQAIDGRLEVRVPSRVRIEDGPYGPRLVAEGVEPPLTVEQVRELVERERR
jgi:AbrB family looped-hinge helix DNA binding protein